MPTEPIEYQELFQLDEPDGADGSDQDRVLGEAYGNNVPYSTRASLSRSHQAMYGRQMPHPPRWEPLEVESASEAAPYSVHDSELLRNFRSGVETVIRRYIDDTPVSGSSSVPDPPDPPDILYPDMEASDPLEAPDPLPPTRLPRQHGVDRGTYETRYGVYQRIYETARVTAAIITPDEPEDDEPEDETTMVKCSGCGVEESCDLNDDWREIDGDWYCPDCYVLCETCGLPTLADATTEVHVFNRNGRISTRRREIFVCESCLNRNFLMCSDCEEWFDRDSRIITSSDCSICAECYEENYFACDDCGEVVHMDDGNSCDYGTYCSYCNDQRIQHNGREEESYERGDCIAEHDYEPSSLSFHTSPDDEERPSLFFGIELEVEKAKSPSSLNNMAKVIGDMWEPKTVYMKYDGSLSCGFEIVTHPFSWGWYLSKKDRIDNMLASLVEHGYRSFKYGSCGIHVHMSKIAFTHMHLYRFLKLFYDSPLEFILKISQRSYSNLCGWAALYSESQHFDEEGHFLDGTGGADHGCSCYECSKKRVMAGAKKTTEEEREKFIRKYKQMHLRQKSQGGSDDGKYVAVNTSRYDTVEVRIFRGTLSPPSFHKDIEFCHAAYCFTEKCLVSDVTVENFIEFVKAKKKTYPNLNAFIERVILGKEEVKRNIKHKPRGVE